MILVIVFLLSLGSFIRAHDEAQCVETAGEIRFTVNTVRNVSGHRTVKANLLSRYSSGQGENGTGLDVHHKWGRCGDTQYQRLETIATSSTTTTRVPARSMSIPAGYEYFPGAGYYKLYTEPTQIWAGAQQFCQSDGGNLIVINSEAEAEIIRSFYSRNISRIESTGSWIGVHDQFKPGYYVTVFGDTLLNAGYEKWGSGQPVNSKHCGYTFKQGFLHTWQCEAHLPFVCELNYNKL